MDISVYRIVGTLRDGSNETFASMYERGKAVSECRLANEGFFRDRGWNARNFRVEFFSVKSTARPTNIFGQY